MATRKQKQELIEALKFTPRDITITLSGYGGEIVMGRISEAAYDYWRDREDLSDFVYDWDGEFEDVPADARFCTDGAWHDIDDICHENGCEAADSSWITVEDLLEHKSIFESCLDLDKLADIGVDTTNHSHCRPSEDEPEGTCVFLGQSFEKGTFFSGDVRITEPFDPKKLSISWTDCDGWRLISGVEYDGEEVEGYDAYSTNGKGSEYRVYQVSKEELDHPEANFDDIYDIGVLEGEEMWASRAIDEHDEVQRWDGHVLTPWWPAKDRPEREGRYQVLSGEWPFPSWATWTKKSGWRDEDGAMENLKSWRGLANPVE
jgi:hypothetical protein